MSPFGDGGGAFLALVNSAGQYSLWPQSITVPAGWRVASGPGSRESCLDYVEVHWTGLGPANEASP
jgi:MbtH protein